MAQINSKQLLKPISGSFSGSLEGTSSYALTASYAMNGGGGGGGTPGGSNYQIQYNSGSTFGGVPTLTYSASVVYASNIQATGSFSGSLQGTSSYATSASYATTASYSDYATSASYAQTSSYALQAESASYSLTASYIKIAQTASYVLNAVSSSYATTASYSNTSISASYAITSSFTTTASYYRETDPVFVAKSASLATTGSNIFIGNQTVTGSLFTTGSNTLIGTTTLTGSFNITGSTTQIGNNNLLGNTTLSGSIQISGSVNALADITIGGTLRLDPATDPGNTNATASFLFTSASNTAQGYDLYYRQDGNLVKFKWLEGGISSGLLYGGIVSGSGTTIYVSSGSGIIMNPNASFTSEISPMFTYVTWPNYSASATYLASSQNTYIWVDYAGVIHQQTYFFDQTQYEQAIPLGRVTHANNTSITGYGSNVQTTYDSDSQQSAFVRAFGPLKINGFSITPHTGSTLKFSIGSGVAYTLGGFYSQTPNSPSHYHSNGFPTASIARAYRSGSGFKLDNNNGNFYTDVDPDKWDDGTGLLNPMSTSNWQIQRVFVNPITGRTVIYYGQYGTYSTLLNALQYLSTDPFTEGEFTANSLIFAGYLVLKGQTNNLNDNNNNRIINAGIFRNIAGGTSGGTGAVAQSLDDLSDVTITTPSNGQPLVYNGGTWINSSSITASLSGTASLANTASYALTASWANNAITASYALVSTSASYASSSTSASYASSSTSASYALTASYALSSAGGGGGGTLYQVGPTSIGNTEIVSYVTGSNRSAFSNYVIYSGSNSRAGQFMTVWNGITTQYTDVSTLDIGDTSTIVFTSSISTNVLKITANTPISWSINMSVIFV